MAVVWASIVGWSNVRIPGSTISGAYALASSEVPTFTKHSSNLAARSSVGTSSDELSRVFELASKRPRTIHHSDRGAQYVSIRYSERLADAGIEPSVGSRGDSYDNAPAETINGLYKTELIHRRAPWKTRESVELATLEWVAWYNHCRLMEPLGYIPPAEAEANYYRQLRNAGGVPALP